MNDDCGLAIMMHLPETLYKFSIGLVSMAQIVDDDVIVVSPASLAEFLPCLLRISHEDIPFDVSPFANSLGENLFLGIVVVVPSPGHK